MGIKCEISLKSPSEVYRSGSIVSGEIKYVLDEATSFKKITMSLKGIGTLSIKKRSSRRKRGGTAFSKEKYVNIEEVILDKANGDGNLNPGSYTASFKFQIPERTPPSVDVFRKQVSYLLKYKVGYFISMKFERTGFLSVTKRFKKEIQVLSDIKPTLPQESMVYGEKKTLFNPFASTESIINLKSTILNSVIKAGDMAQFEYEISNQSHVTIKSVETKIVELINAKKRRKHVVFEKDLEGTDSKSGTIENGRVTQSIVDIKIPENALTIDSCELAERNYAILIIVELPMPHINFQLTIPIQVQLKEEIREEKIKEETDDPPSYWDVMREDKKELMEGFE